jgi:hypothetical protein
VSDGWFSRNYVICDRVTRSVLSHISQFYNFLIWGSTDGDSDKNTSDTILLFLENIFIFFVFIYIIYNLLQNRTMSKSFFIFFIFNLEFIQSILQKKSTISIMYV